MKTLSFSQKYTYPKKDDPFLLYTTKALYRRYVDDHLSQVGGQLAYFFVLSLFPLLMLINQLIGFFHIDPMAISIAFGDIFSGNIAVLVDDYLEYLRGTTSSGIFTFSAFFTLYIVSKAITSLIFALNRAFRVDIETSNIQKRVLAFFVTIFLMFAVFLSLVLVTAGKDIMLKIALIFNFDTAFLRVWTLIRWTIVVSTLFLSLFTIYSIVPFKNFPKKYVAIGSLFTMISWLVLSSGFAWYVNNLSNYSTIYGSLGAIMLLLLFLYFFGIIVVLGGELSHILSQRAIGNFEYDVKPFSKKRNMININKNKF